MRWAAVERALIDGAAIILAAWESFPDRVAPQLVGVDDAEKIRAILKAAVDENQAVVATAMDPARAQRAVRGE